MRIDIDKLSPSAQQQIAEKSKKRGRPRKNKYHAIKTWAYGVCFDSKKESKYYADCKRMKDAGELAGFLFHGKFVLVEGDDKDHRAITYQPDFILLHNDGTYEIVDTKSDATETASFRDKMKIMYERFPKVKPVTIAK